MNVNNEVKAYLAMAGWTLTSVAKELTSKHDKNVSVQNLSNKLTNETIRYNEVVEIANIIGYDLVWTKRAND